MFQELKQVMQQDQTFILPFSHLNLKSTALINMTNALHINAGRHVPTIFEISSFYIDLENNY